MLQFFQKLFIHYPNPHLYLRGGSVISLKLLQDNYKFPIKDFDFVLEDERCCNDYFYYEFGKEFGIYLNGSPKPSQGKNTKLHVLRNRKLKYELSVCVKDSLELPMTSMKILITEDNYIPLFDLMENIKESTPFIKQLNIIIPNHVNGMFVCAVSPSLGAVIPSLTGELQSINTSIDAIICNTSNDIIHQQFIYYMIKNPTNIARLKFKNSPKSEQIKKLHQYTWLVTDDMVNLINLFIVNLTIYIDNIYNEYKNDIDLTNQILNNNLYTTNLTLIYIEMFQKIDKLFENVNITRWKDTFSQSDPLLTIFQFSSQLNLKIKSKILSESVSWLIVKKMI